MGLIQSAWSGTRIESWMSTAALNASGFADFVPQSWYGHQNDASHLYNAMVAPWNSFQFRAVIWYQGEANGNEEAQGKMIGVDTSEYYAGMLQSMITDWRSRKDAHFPFINMQLAPCVAAGTPVEHQLGESWQHIRLAQQRTTQALVSYGNAIGMDLGGSSAWKIQHPPNKNEMARRLALHAAHVVYGVEERLPALVQGAGGADGLTTWTGPMPMLIRASSAGDSVLIDFEPNSSRLMSLRDVKAANIDGSRNDCTLCCSGSAPFEVKFSGMNWTRVSSSNTTIRNSTVKLIVGNALAVDEVRYAWQNFVQCVLQNEDQLPAIPFVRNVNFGVKIVLL